MSSGTSLKEIEYTKSMGNTTLQLGRKNVWPVKVPPIGSTIKKEHDYGNGKTSTNFKHSGGTILNDIVVYAKFRLALQYTVDIDKPIDYIPVILGKVEGPYDFNTVFDVAVEESKGIPVDIVDHMGVRALPWHNSLTRGEFNVNGATLETRYGEVLDPILRTTPPQLLQKLGNHHVLDQMNKYHGLGNSTGVEPFDVNSERVLKGDIYSRGVANNIVSKVWYTLNAGKTKITQIHQVFEFDTYETYLANGWNIDAGIIQSQHQLEGINNAKFDIVVTYKQTPQLWHHVFGCIKEHDNDGKLAIDMSNATVKEQGWVDGQNGRSSVEIHIHEADPPAEFRYNEYTHKNPGYWYIRDFQPRTSGTNSISTGSFDVASFENVYFFVRKKPTALKPWDTQTYKRIKDIKFSYGSTSNDLYQMKAYELWKLSDANNLQTDLIQFTKDGMVGSLCILGVEQVPGRRVANDMVSSSFSLEVTTVDPITADDELIVVFRYGEHLYIMNDGRGQAIKVRANVTPDIVQGAVKDELTTYHGELSGGFFGFLKKIPAFLGKVLRGVSDNRDTIANIADRGATFLGSSLNTGGVQRTAGQQQVLLDAYYD